ncbi:hypothetical protein O9992_00600 [Vibrio lentus]|nr:hypothetical protein [Vibrio lentus]
MVKGVMEEYLELDMLDSEAISKEAGFPIEREVYGVTGQSIEQGLLFEYRRKTNEEYTTLRNLGDGRWFVPMFVVHPNYRSKAVFSCVVPSNCRDTQEQSSKMFWPVTCYALTNCQYSFTSI